MANKTIYPFGQNGQVPSGYPIADDLITNSAQQALSAKQGVVLDKKIDGLHKVVDIDIQSMGGFWGAISANNVWTTTQTHRSAEVPVEPGQHYILKGNASNTGYYAFLKTISFWSNGGTLPFSDSQNGRVAVSANSTVEIVIPEDTHYLYVALMNGSTNQKPQSLQLIVDDAIKDEIDESKDELSGDLGNKCNYATDVFTNVGANIAVEKVGQNGYLVRNKTKSSNQYALYTLPSSLIDGETYWLSFDYTSWLASAWSFNLANSSNQPATNPARGVSIPATGKGYLVFRFTKLPFDAKLRLASNSQNGDASVLIENLCITKLAPRLSSLGAQLARLDSYALARTEGTFTKYNGRRIDLSEPGFRFIQGMSMNNHQSSAIYGDYIFAFTDKMAKVYLYNKRTQSLLYTLNQTEKDSLHHCNQSFFGTEFYDESDPFPLIYLTVNNNGTTAGGYMEAYRIIPVMGAGDYESFTMELVQTVTLPIMSASNALGNANFVYNPNDKRLYTYSRDNDSGSKICRITKWAMPTLSQGDITLTEENILDSWETGVSAVNMQGAAIKNNYLFIFRGYVTVGYIYLYVFDLFRKERVATIDLLNNGFTMEPEGVFFDGNVLCTTGTAMYLFWFN